MQIAVRDNLKCTRFEAMVFESLGHYITTSEKKPILVFEFVDWAEQLSNSFQPGDAQRFILNCNYSLYDFDVDPMGKGKSLTSVQTTGTKEFIAYPNPPQKVE